MINGQTTVTKIAAAIVPNQEEPPSKWNNDNTKTDTLAISFVCNDLSLTHSLSLSFFRSIFLFQPLSSHYHH